MNSWNQVHAGCMRFDCKDLTSLWSDSSPRGKSIGAEGTEGEMNLGCCSGAERKGWGGVGGGRRQGRLARVPAHGELPSYFHSACSGKPLVSEQLGQWVRKRVRK